MSDNIVLITPTPKGRRYVGIYKAKCPSLRDPSVRNKILLSKATECSRSKFMRNTLGW